ncbi:hypothetical protein VCR12J2_640234 [Vibrio coralliirubri]|nr:hypothetical protein VCR12J2_640234 [Vibrio coralliirubri]
MLGVHCCVRDWRCDVVDAQTFGSKKAWHATEVWRCWALEDRLSDCGCYFGTVSTGGCNDRDSNAVGLVTVFTCREIQDSIELIDTQTDLLFEEVSFINQMTCSVCSEDVRLDTTLYLIKL